MKWETHAGSIAFCMKTSANVYCSNSVRIYEPSPESKDDEEEGDGDGDDIKFEAGNWESYCYVC